LADSAALKARAASRNQGRGLFDGIKRLFGFSTPQPAPPVSRRAAERALELLSRQLSVEARYENAQTTEENQRNWWLADYLSAKSANNFHVRRTLRMRSRHEVSNNPYLFGVVNSNADDLIGTGPKLQALTNSSAKNKQIESAWESWAAEVGLTEKLRTCKIAKEVDGEGVNVLKTVRDLEHPVKLYPCDIEADQMTTPAPLSLTELWVDGLVLHPVTGRPKEYTILRTHPGDFFFPNLNPLEYDRIKAKWVVHWFRKFRPGQVRGVPVFTPALDLFAELRAYRKAILTKAQLAANLTAVLETEASASQDDDGSQATPWQHIPVDRGTQTTLPAGAKLKQYVTGEPAATYEEFQEKCLGEACRPIAYPLNLALGTSQKFNFSSAQLDHINYRNSLDVERADCNVMVLDHYFRAFVAEAVFIPGLLPTDIRSAADIPHEWHWPGYAPLDPLKDAQADHARLSNGTVTYQQFWARRGYDWRLILAQQAEEQKEIERLGLDFGDPRQKTERIQEDEDADQGGDKKPPAKGPDGKKPKRQPANV